MSNKQSHSIIEIHSYPTNGKGTSSSQPPWGVMFKFHGLSLFFSAGVGQIPCLTMFPRGHALPRGKTGSKTKIHIDIEAALCRHPRRFTCIKMCKHEKTVHIIYIYTLCTYNIGCLYNRIYLYTYIYIYILSTCIVQKQSNFGILNEICRMCEPCLIMLDTGLQRFECCYFTGFLARQLDPAFAACLREPGLTVVVFLDEAGDDER